MFSRELKIIIFDYPLLFGGKSNHVDVISMVPYIKFTIILHAKMQREDMGSPPPPRVKKSQK